jgi:POT family proton-dependent oligopeptide transporter
MDHRSRMVNVGSLGSIATTLMEKYIGFWSAYLLDLCAVVLAVVVVHLAKPKFGMIQRRRRTLC